MLPHSRKLTDNLRYKQLLTGPLIRDRAPCNPMVIKDRRDVRSSGPPADSPEEVAILCHGALLPLSTHGLSQTPSTAPRPMYERVFPSQAAPYTARRLWHALDPQGFP